MPTDRKKQPSPPGLRASTVITCHANADWDAFASMTVLTRLYPDAVLVFPGSMEAPINQFYNDTASSRYAFVSLKELDLEAVRLLVLADTAQPARVPHVQPILDRQPEIHVWDHHPDSPETVKSTVAHIANVGATCTLVAEAICAQGQPSGEEATLLGLGIYADTGNFTYESTTPRDYEAAARLRQAGMDLRTVADLVQHTMTSRHVRLLNSLLDSAASHQVGTLTVVMAVADMDVFVSDFALLAQKFMEMEACDVLFAIGNMDDKILVVARSRARSGIGDSVDVGAVCRALGGGGHPSAASATVKDMSLSELKDALFRAVYAQINPDKTARHIMSTPAVGLDHTSPLQDAESLMTRYGLKAAPVFRKGTRHCIGYMEAQLASRAVTHGLGEISVMEYMQRKVFTVAPDATLQRLMDIVVGGRQRLVPVVDCGDTVGVVTRTDLINMFVTEPGRLPAPREMPTERDLTRILRTRLPRWIRQLMQHAQTLADEMSVGVYAVGGFVRDLLLSRPASELDDVDLVVESNGIRFAHRLATALNGRVREHRAFMTALVIFTDGEGLERRIDVATARLEYYRYPAALPVVELSSLKMDLFRRDFTINAMAIRLNADRYGRLVDFFGGQSDVQRRIIRVIHALSFVEDPTRILRAVRFEQRYGFHLSVQCEKLIKNALKLELVFKVAGRRLMHELQLIFQEQAPLASLQRLQKLEVLQAIHPLLTLTPDRIALFGKLREVLDWYRLLYFKEQPDVAVIYLLALSNGMSFVDAEAIYTRLELSPPFVAELLSLRESMRITLSELQSLSRTPQSLQTAQPAKSTKVMPPVSTLHRLLVPYSLESLLYLMARSGSEATSRHFSQFICKWREVKADITGNDLRDMGFEPGPNFAILLERALAAKLDGLAPTRIEQLDFVRKAAVDLYGPNKPGTDISEIDIRR